MCVIGDDFLFLVVFLVVGKCWVCEGWGRYL